MVAQVSWSLGIGNPTLGSWIIVVMYLLASISCWGLARKLTKNCIGTSREHLGWRVIAVLLFVLGIIKLLDLQTSVTQAARNLAFSERWYAQRQAVQMAVIVLLALSFIVAAIVLLICSRNAPLPTLLAFVGATFVLSFVMIRAISFHPVDRFIGKRVLLGLSWNWILEMSAISLILLMSQFRGNRRIIS